MANLQTTYLGLNLANPLVIAASSVTTRIENLALAERFGAGAVVLRSLFEEQILAGNDAAAAVVAADGVTEAVDLFPPVRCSDAEEYIRRIERAKAAVSIPVIASLNAVKAGSWSRYAKQMEAAGADAIELNVYAVATDPTVSAASIERELLSMVASVVTEVKIPVSVKLSPYYTSLVHVVAEIARCGSAGVVLFNRFLQPDIDPVAETLNNVMGLSSAADLRLPLRYTALLHGRVGCDLAISSGVHRGEDVVRALLAGATVAQIAATVIKNGVHYVATMLRDLEAWMDQRGYQTIAEVRGRLSQQAVDDPFAFERAQYVDLLMQGSGNNPLNTRIG